MSVDEIYVYESPSRLKRAEKIIQDAGELGGNHLEPRKARSQFHNASHESEIAIFEHCYIMIGSDP